MAYDKVIDSTQLETALTTMANAIREKTGGTASLEWVANKGFADIISGISAGGGLEIKSFTVADTTKNFIVETLDDVPRLIAWFDADWGLNADTIIDQYRPILGAMLKKDDGESMQATSVYKSSSSKATNYSCNTMGNKTTTVFNENYNASSFSTDALRVVYGNSKKVIAVNTIGNYAFRNGQTINYIVVM